jgi:uncharacterized RDD family membrane protein YckC
VTAPPVEGRAGVVTRLLVAVADTAAVALMTAALYAGTAAVRFTWSPVSFRWPQPTPPISVLATALIATVYLAVGWATTGRTYGAGLLGVRVLSSRCELLGWTRSALRALACVLLPVGLLWVALSPTRRSVQDLLLGSVVVYDWHRDGGARATSHEHAAVQGDVP